MRISQFNRIARLSPCPVSICNIRPSCFYWGSYGEQQRIEIEDSIKSQPERVTVLLHEIGHAIHYRRHCKCFTNDSYYLQEYHAEKFALQFMLRYKLTGALRWNVHDFEHNLDRYPLICKKVFAQLQQDKIWHKCKKYLTCRAK